MRLTGTWNVEGDKLTLAFNAQPPVTVTYTVSDGRLTITNDPATVRANEHRDVVYTRR